MTVTFRGGGVAHAKEGTDNIYASIDLVSHKIARAIKRHNGRSRGKSRQQTATVASDILASVDTEESTDFDISELISDLDTHYVKDIDEKVILNFNFLQSMTLNSLIIFNRIL